ncbi:MAG: hypothetical protein ACRC1H_11060, partial [Caldilineaceae bacterium]
KPGDVGLAQRYRLFNRTYTPGQLVGQLMELLTLANGPVQTDLKGLKDDIRDLRAMMMVVKKPDPVRRIFWVMGYALFALAIGVPMFEVMGTHGELYWRALGAMIVLFGVALLFFLYGLGMMGRPSS